MKPANVWRLYRIRLRARRLQECFAAAGVAAGVALLFASQIASSSLLGSAAELSRGIVGKATLQLMARDPEGMPQRLLQDVRALPGVRRAAPLFEANANAIGPDGKESVELVGADAELSRLGGELVRHTSLEPFGGIGAIVLPATLARTLGVRKFGQEAVLQVGGRTTHAPLYEQLGRKQIGSLVSTPLVIAPLSFAQQMAGREHRLSRILVEPSPGRTAEARSGLLRLGAGGLSVESTEYDGRLLSNAASATNQSTSLFAVLSALVGFLFAYNAMLLTVVQKRRLIVDLRRDGYTARTALTVLLVDALVLALVACALGLALGDGLSLWLFGSPPSYLSSAFSLAPGRVLSIESVVVALAGGMLASIVAVLAPMRDLVSNAPLVGRTGPAERLTGGRAGIGALLCLAGAIFVQVAAPGAAVVGMVLLLATVVLALPPVLRTFLALVQRVAARLVSAVPHIAAMELSAVGTRAIAIAATGAVAMFGSVSIEGAHGDLLSGLEGAARDMNASADAWISPAGSFDLLQTEPFASGPLRTLRHVPGVRAIQLYRGGLLDIGTRRVWVIAPPIGAEPLLPASQISEGDLGLATRRLRQGGWVVLSRALAREHGWRLGQRFTLPSPDPQSFRVAALSANIGWAPGAIIMSSVDFARAWGSLDASAYGVSFEPGITAKAGVARLRRALGAGTGLAVESAARHAQRQRTLSREGLARLSQITVLIVLGAVLAMVAAMGSMIWQRRGQMARLKLEGFAQWDLWRMLMMEGLILLGCGCATGACLGLYGQQLLDRALERIIDFPVDSSIAWTTALVGTAAVVASGLAVLAVPAYLAAGVTGDAALGD